MKNKWIIKSPQGERVEQLRKLPGMKRTTAYPGNKTTAMFEHIKTERLLKDGSVSVISTSKER